MKPTVHILVRVRKRELLETALLVFRSLRTGFPSAPVQVWGNALSLEYEDVVARAAAAVGAHFANIAVTSHDAWVESLVLETTSAFWICDSDVVFWGDVESRGASAERRGVEFMGRYEPAFEEPYTNCRHVERLHTCLMWIDPAATRAAMRAFMARIPEDLRQWAQFPLIREYFIPVRDGGALLSPVFYDTMAGMYQAGAGRAFDEETNDCFDHLNCGSYVDLISPKLSQGSALAGGAPSRPTLREVHAAVLANPALLRGARHAQAKWYEEHQPKLAGMSRTAATGIKKKKGAICHTHRE